jgi:hypothetical protein
VRAGTKKRKVIKIAACLAVTATFDLTNAAAQGEVRLVYAQDYVFYFTDAHAHVLREVEVNVPIGTFSVSPDASAIVFSSGTSRSGGDLRLLSATTGRITLLRRSSPKAKVNPDASKKEWTEEFDAPEFSPSGESIAYATKYEEVRGRPDPAKIGGPLAVMGLAQRNTRNILTTTSNRNEADEDIRNISWSPNGHELLLNVNGIATITDAENGVLRTLNFAPNSQVKGSAYGWFGEACVILDRDSVGSPHKPENLALFDLKTRSLKPLLDTLKVPAGDLPSFFDFEMSGSLLLFKESEYRIFLYDAATRQAVATIDANRARLVPTTHAGASCE